MAMGIWLPGGGGADLDVITAGAGDVLAGKVIVDKDGEPLAGTLALSGNASDGQVLNGQTYYNTDAKTKRIGTMPNRGAVSRSLAINGSYTIPAGYHNGSGKVSQSIPTQGGSTTTPGTANKTIVAAGRYVSGNIVVVGDPDLKAENIKKGVTIFGITGTHEGFVPGPLEIYNRGSWGSGYSQNDVTLYRYRGNGSIYFEPSAIRVNGYATGNNAATFGIDVFKNNNKNISAYSTFNAIVKARVDEFDATMYLYLKSPNDVTIASKAYKTTGSEVTVSLDISNQNITGYFEIGLVRSMGASLDEVDAYVHKLWFT